jgi:hypothetical protein
MIPDPEDNSNLDPSMLLMDSNLQAHRLWTEFKNLEIPNSQPRDRAILEAEQNCLGYGIAYAAGPFSIFQLFNVLKINPRPFVEDNVVAIHELLASGKKHDWQHPLVAQISLDHLDANCIQHMKLVNPRSLDSAIPHPLLGQSHTSDILRICSSLWTETNPETGEYLSQMELQSLGDELATFSSENWPQLYILNGAHRLEAQRRLGRRAFELRYAMIQAGRAGNEQQFTEHKQALDELIDLSSFLVAVYPSKYLKL